MIPPEDDLLKDDSQTGQVPVSGGVEPAAASPRWGSTTKLVIGLSLAAISAFLVFRFLNIIGPLLLAFILAYFFYPIAGLTRQALRLPWRGAVTLVYVVLLILILGSIALGGLALIDQVQSLIGFLTRALNGLPDFINSVSATPYMIGPFTIDLRLLDLNAIGNQILGAVQPILSQAGTSVVSLATSAATFFGWIFFILLISYFVMAESGGASNRLIKLSIPGHDEDIRRLGAELNRIWNAFLRGQVTIVLLTILIYNILLGGLGVHYFFGLALLAGLARFIPYVGPFVAWTSYGLVSYFQGSTIFGLPPLGYAILVVAVAWSTDFVIDNFVTPRLMSSALSVHPAAVMISALVGLNLLGVIGMILAAPVLATCRLILDYIFAKLFDQDPWERIKPSPPMPIIPVFAQIRERFDRLLARINRTGISRSK